MVCGDLKSVEKDIEFMKIATKRQFELVDGAGRQATKEPKDKKSRGKAYQNAICIDKSLRSVIGEGLWQYHCAADMLQVAAAHKGPELSC